MKKLISLSLLLILLLGACKPTERNYKAVYDAARAKREAVDDALAIPPGALQSADGPAWRVVDGDSVLWLSQPLSLEKGETGIPDGPVGGIGAFNVAVGAYSLPTNPLDQAASLRREGYDAYVVKGMDGKFYCVASGFPTAAEATAFIRAFQGKHPGYPTVGLPGIVVLEK